MEIKIQCHCGTKYKFEFEPVNGRVPFVVNCPNCSADATDFANSRVQQLEQNPTPVVVATATIASAAPLRVRLHTPAHEPLQVPAHEAAPPPGSPAPRVFVPPAAKPYSPDDGGLSPKFFLGLLGGALGVLVGCTVWYLIFHFTGTRLRLLALLVGCCGGLGAKLLSKDEGSNQLGMITAVFVLIGIIFTAYFIGRERAHSFAGGVGGGFYKEQMAYAKRAVKAVPNGTEDEARIFLAREESRDGEKIDPKSVENAEVRRFRDVDLAHYRELASGKILEKDFSKTEARWLYETRVADAKRALAMMPNESDPEIRAYLAQESAGEDKKREPGAITPEEISQFRSDSLPEFKTLASGQEMPGASVAVNTKSAEEELTEAESKSPWVKFMYFFAGWGFGGVGILFVTLGVSYKMCTNA